ncbi:hypothetical protein AVEN_204391-1 [Araneus ventricosus]|uniref:Uncharacterized protein n=1 Tax=Araneus ventricosus TaxID=182803 RepID=A0A4Y2KDM5_ARAVE|nr:hypothetical protein AVEN_204391-1 [Araneus ventricosus]
MTRTPELAPLSKLPHNDNGENLIPIHGGSLVESGFESGTLSLEHRDPSGAPLVQIPWHKQKSIACQLSGIHIFHYTQCTATKYELRIVSELPGHLLSLGTHRLLGPTPLTRGNWLLSLSICEVHSKRVLLRLSLVGGRRDQILPCRDDFRNGAYLWLFKLCSIAGTLYIARNIFSPACEIASDVDEGL